MSAVFQLILLPSHYRNFCKYVAFCFSGTTFTTLSEERTEFSNFNLSFLLVVEDVSHDREASLKNIRSSI